jgi:hypothetical protein
VARILGSAAIARAADVAADDRLPREGAWAMTVGLTSSNPDGNSLRRRVDRRRLRPWLAGAACLTVAIGGAPAAAAPTVARASGSARSAAVAAAANCSAGARTLSHRGDHVYPETGNGGYRSVHTDVHMVYDAASNQFLTGNHVDLVDQAAKCLTSFSVDFERTSPFANGPNLTVGSVTVNGQPASFRFVQPTYPGDPNGVNDPNPRAHEASQVSPVGGPDHNPLPPACSPELPPQDSAHALDGTQCPANKMVITPASHIASGAGFTVEIAYTGRPGVHEDGDGTTEGWFRSNSPAGDGGFVTTEPVGTEDWMPLNDHPSAKPTYDFFDTVPAGKTAIANGILVSRRSHGPNANFPDGSTTFHWHAAEPIASYLVEDSVGSFILTEHTADNGVRYYEGQPAALSAKRRAANRAIMNQQQDITQFQSQFNGAYPFTSAGVLIGLPPASFEEEMETMITFAGGSIDLDTLNHENMHQWWGDNVTESNYNMTFFKEGLATLGEYLFSARTYEKAHGGPFSRAGQAAFQRSLVHRFDITYARPRLWRGAPSNPMPYTLFETRSTYLRPGTAYLAVRQILGSANFTKALQGLQRQYGGNNVTEPELEAGFQRWLPNRSTACHSRLSQFFTQWFDTSYPTASGARRPTITGPGLAGGGFYRKGGVCG